MIGSTPAITPPTFSTPGTVSDVGDGMQRLGAGRSKLPSLEVGVLDNQPLANRIFAIDSASWTIEVIRTLLVPADSISTRRSYHLRALTKSPRSK